MNAFAIRLGYSFHYSFRHRWVRVNCTYNLMSGCFKVACNNCFSNQLSYVRADHMASEPFAVFLIENDLYKSFFMAKTCSFTAGREWEFTDHDIIPFILRLLLC